MDNKTLQKKKMILIDGNGLAYRAFYALPPLKTSQGEPMNAVYGFTNILFQILEDEKPDFAAVAFDKSRPTKRLEQFDEYKAHRQKMPEELEIQFPFIEQVVRTLKIPVFWAEGYEADDCIATLTHMAEEKGFFTKIYSGDLDMLQLVSPNTHVVTTRRGISDLVVYDEKLVVKRYGINPPQLVDYKALAGDSSDHIPGIPGIGEASASKLLNQFDRIESMYENPDSIPSRWRKQILENQEQAYLSKSLASLEKNLDLNVDWDYMAIKDPDRVELKKLFVRLEFKTMLKRLGFTDEELEDIQEITVMIVGKDEDLDTMTERIKAAGSFALHLMIDEGELVGMALAEGKTNAYYFPFIIPDSINISSTFGISIFSRDRVVYELKSLLDNDNVYKYIYNLKSAIKFLKRGEYFTGKKFIDLSIIGSLLEPENPPRSIETLMSRYSDFQPKTLEEIINQKKSRKKLKITEIPLQDLTLFAAGRAVRANKLGPDLLKKLEEEGVSKIFFELEMPVVSVLAAMQNRGLRIDKKALSEESKNLELMLNKAAREIYDIAGKVFNINSSKQLSRVLFEDLKLSSAKKTATGFKTGANVLEKLVDEHPIVQKILDYRHIFKIKTNYLDTIKNQLTQDSDRIRISFHQNINPYGKITSTSPNAANMPQHLRRLIIPSDQDRVLMAFRFDHLEARLLAQMSEDQKLLDIMQKEGCFYTHLAAAVYEVSPESVDENMKWTLQNVISNIIEGVSPHNLSKELSMGRNEAKELIDKFFMVFEGVKSFREKLIQDVQNKGYVSTIMGRKRNLPNIASKNKNMRTLAEKTAFTALIKGSASDIIKKALIGIFDKIIKGHRDIHILMQYDDEILLETKTKRADKYSGEIKQLLEDIAELPIPLSISVFEGPHWGALTEKNQVLTK